MYNTTISQLLAPERNGSGRVAFRKSSSLLSVGFPRTLTASRAKGCQFQAFHPTGRDEHARERRSAHRARPLCFVLLQPRDHSISLRCLFLRSGTNRNVPFSRRRTHTHKPRTISLRFEKCSCLVVLLLFCTQRKRFSRPYVTCTPASLATLELATKRGGVTK